MPRVHSGTSAGGVLAALVCTRKDDELHDLLRPELASRVSAFEEPFSVWGKRAWKTGARFDGVHWARKVSLCCSMAIVETDLAAVLLVYPRLHDVQGGLHANRTYPQYLGHASRST
jgi:hypothetical protein